MKKVVHWFTKKRKVVISDGVDADAVPEQPRDIPRHFAKQTNLYNNFLPDNSCSSNHKTVSNVPNNIGAEIREEPLIVNGPLENETNLSSPITPHENGEVIRPAESSDLVEEIPRLPVVASNNGSQVESVRDASSVNSSGNLSRYESFRNMQVQEADSVNSLQGEWIPKKILGDKKNGGNTYVITISNSTHFHIGTQKTINYPGADDNNVIPKKAPQLQNVSNGRLLALDGNQVLDIKDKLSEDDLVQISLSVRDKWPELARNLGMDDSKIQEWEELNDSDYNLIVYDLLHEYLNKYPETTVGYMVNVLRKSNEIEAIRKLTEKR